MHILFVCTGNTCRSPMAASIARRVADERGLADVVVASAGTGALDGSPASDGALLVAMERGSDLSDHRSRVLTRELVESSDVILVMSGQHLARVHQLGGTGKSFLLTEFASHGADAHGVSDPFGGDLSTYRATFEELERVIRRAFDRLVTQGTQGAPPTHPPGE
jgi:protein-tyrosine-phosphatase